ncbi:hypothetical protein AX774_g3170 [Zancudomyces culisetae]|uniref:Uncharacterized protein n=1 Tax=Zancudomyces culisetae TaxID=1213189 RepID=A0A1R1PQU4_ZANCU|nr:hypothetical protein AX774_g3170 [Zancudomyces culisetae]|eukprot:OMH83328.1 hypothetical protein AX774_g3170 [Zancudomyces culisetae]
MFRAIPTPTPKQQTTNGKIQAEKTNEKTMDVKEKSGMMAGGNLKNTPYTNSTVSTVKEMASRSQNVEEINVIGNEVTPQRNKDSTPNMTKCAPKDQMDGKTNNGASDKAMFGVGVGVGVGVFGIHKADEITRVLNDMLQPLPSKLDRLKTSVRTVITNKDENTNRTSKSTVVKEPTSTRVAVTSTIASSSISNSNINSSLNSGMSGRDVIGGKYKQNSNNNNNSNSNSNSNSNDNNNNSNNNNNNGSVSVSVSGNSNSNSNSNNIEEKEGGNKGVIKIELDRDLVQMVREMIKSQKNGEQVIGKAPKRKTVEKQNKSEPLKK